MLGQRGAGIEDQVEIAEIGAPQVRILAHVLDQHGEGGGDVERDGVTHILEVFDRASESLRRRLAVVDIERPAIGQHQIEIVAAAEHVVPGKPVEDLRRMLAQEGPDLSDLQLVDAHHPMRRHHALGGRGRARREQDFCQRLGADGRMSGRQVDAGIAGEQRGECSMSRPAVCLGGDDLGPGQCLDRQRFCEPAGIGDEDHCRPYRVENAGQPPAGFGQQRVLLGQRRQRDAGILGGESENGVIDAVARQHGDGAIRPEPARQQGAGDGLHAFQRLAIGEPPPSRTGAFGDEGARRHLVGPAVQPVCRGLDRGAQRQRGSDEHCAVAAVFGRHLLRRKAVEATLHRRDRLLRGQLRTSSGIASESLGRAHFCRPPLVGQ